MRHCLAPSLVPFGQATGYGLYNHVEGTRRGSTPPASRGANASSASCAVGLLFGAAYNFFFAIEVLWSSHVFRERPSTGLAAVMFMSGLGLLGGPLWAGWLADWLGLGPVLFGASLLLLLTGLLYPRGEFEPHSPEQAA
jgi:MFS family permease